MALEWEENEDMLTDTEELGLLGTREEMTGEKPTPSGERVSSVRHPMHRL